MRYWLMKSEPSDVSIDDLAAMMLALQAKGCHNVNLVTPTHYSPHILLAVDKAAARGLRVPIVWNTCGWEKADILKTLDGTTTLEEVSRVTDQSDILKSIYLDLMSSDLSHASFVTSSLYTETAKNVSSFPTFQAYALAADPKLRLQILFAAAIELRAGDIHVEPTDQDFAIRLRIDGMLQTVARFPLNEYPSFIGDIKNLVGLKTSERAGVTDKRFSITLEQPTDAVPTGKVDVRLSLIPGGFGETVVMRLLNQSASKLSLEKLNLRKENLVRILAAANTPNGIILNTGPTGSGKTTTLYTLLNAINQPGTKIITAEDPIEYSLPGIVQTEVSKDKTYTFASALRAIVRQDPDVILIGEIRDDETADIAVNAALTGHLVFSTLHANSAPGAIPRFIELGVKPSILTASINILIAQRLVRKLCTKCRQSHTPTEEEQAVIKKLLSTLSPKIAEAYPKEAKEVWTGAGCPECNGTGYAGQLVLSETIPIDNTIKDLIARGALTHEIEEKALENGMVTIAQDGALSAIEGATSLDEVRRVANV